MNVPIFSSEQKAKYAETRLCGSNVTPAMVDEILLYNGFLPSMLEQKLEGTNAQRVQQENGREPIYYTSDRILHISQFSGFGRRKRYEEMIDLYKEICGRDLRFKSLELHDNPRQTNLAYDNYAYDFVKKLFIEGTMNDISTILIGPVQAVSKQAERRCLLTTEYIDAQVIVVDEREVLNLSYVYADQAGIILDKMMREYEALTKNQGKNPKEISVYMFGRVGGLHEEMQRQDILIPTSIIDEIDLLENKPQKYPIHNIFNNGSGRDGVCFNPSSVIRETLEQLEQAKSQGCIGVEMEVREAVESINRARRRYQGRLHLRFGFVGYVSDLPLKGDTLAEELDSDRGEQKAVEIILKDIIFHAQIS